jgi:MoaA/NifB/PqqE/SkfB family radical SAM enzyme
MTMDEIEHVLQQAKELGTITSIYFEGGEPFLYYVPLVQSVQKAAEMGFQVGIVTNTYWATSRRDALEWLRPFAGLVQDLSISSDLFHYSEKVSRQTENARAAAEELGIPLGVISIAQPEETEAAKASGQLPLGESGIMYRGRAADVLVEKASRHPWQEFKECPYENLRDPGRVHVDPYGNVHICQGISIGNMLQTPLREICENYDPDAHPITGPILRGGPAELVRQHDLGHEEEYADACHLCDDARRKLRDKFMEILMPDQMYGVPV